MTREILFRGKRLNEDGWVYDDLSVHVQYGTPHVFPVDGYDSADCYEVAPATVGQYTGLTDKNGVKIFEGDILQRKSYFYDPCKLQLDSDSSFMLCGVVVWDETSKTFPPFRNIQVEGKHGNLCKYVFDCEFDVIGNIHDNPELLEVQNEAD